MSPWGAPTEGGGTLQAKQESGASGHGELKRKRVLRGDKAWCPGTHQELRQQHLGDGHPSRTEAEGRQTLSD